LSRFGVLVKDLDLLTAFGANDAPVADQPDRTEQITLDLAAACILSDGLIAKLNAAGTLIIGAPMYNFGMPSTLKARFDHVLRAGVTFSYSENGLEGLLKGKRADSGAIRTGIPL
jgi:FMN-dependent NADH-azoreductase